MYVFWTCQAPPKTSNMPNNWFDRNVKRYWVHSSLYMWWPLLSTIILIYAAFWWIFPKSNACVRNSINSFFPVHVYLSCLIACCRSMGYQGGVFQQGASPYAGQQGWTQYPYPHQPYPTTAPQVSTAINGYNFDALINCLYCFSNKVEILVSWSLLIYHQTCCTCTVLCIVLLFSGSLGCCLLPAGVCSTGTGSRCSSWTAT